GRVDAAEGAEVLTKLDAFRHLGEGTRRSLRLSIEGLELAPLGSDGVLASFVLPKGGYATTGLGRGCRLVDGSRSGSRQGEELDDATSSDAVGGAQESD